MYKTYYLRFASQEEWDTKAGEAGYKYQDSETQQISYSVDSGAIDVVGVLYNDDIVINEEEELVSPATPKEGWHVNIRVIPNSEIIDGETQTIRDISLPEILNNHIVEPQTPSRVFA
jgi:hypothetical protein